MLDLDLTLAILHHVFVFALFGVLFAEFVVVRRGIDAAGAARVVAIDAWYGVLAALILARAQLCCRSAAPPRWHGPAFLRCPPGRAGG